jgi:hypothetical protein
MTTLSGAKVTRLSGAASPAVRRAPGRNATSARLARLAAEDYPWDTRDFFRLLWVTCIGAVAIAVCWYGSSGEPNFHRQIVWLAGGIGGLLVAGFGMVGWLLAGLRNVHRETFELMDVIRVQRLHHSPEVDGFDADEDMSEAADGYVIGASMTRVHRGSCPLVKGKSVGPISEADVARLDLAKCGVCCQ